MPYRSDYGASRALSAAQKLAEVACERLAAAEGDSLGHRFWATKAWSGRFAAQLRHANALLKIYDAEAAFAALAALPHARSLSAPFLAERVAAEQDRIDRNRTRAEDAGPIPTDDVAAAPRGRAPGPNARRDRLKDL